MFKIYLLIKHSFPFKVWFTCKIVVVFSDISAAKPESSGAATEKEKCLFPLKQLQLVILKSCLSGIFYFSF